MRSSRVRGWDLAESCGWDLALCGCDLAEFVWMRSSRSSLCGWDLAECVDEIKPSVWMRYNRVVWMRSSRVVRAADNQCRSRNCPRFDLSILCHSGIWEAADEAVLNIAHKKYPENSSFEIEFCVDLCNHVSRWMLKVRKCEIFLSLSDSCHFYTIKPPWIHCKGKR
jgi:hypothetical protein